MATDIDLKAELRRMRDEVLRGIAILIIAQTFTLAVIMFALLSNFQR